MHIFWSALNRRPTHQHFCYCFFYRAFPFHSAKNAKNASIHARSRNIKIMSHWSTSRFLFSLSQFTLQCSSQSSIHFKLIIIIKTNLWNRINVVRFPLSSIFLYYYYFGLCLSPLSLSLVISSPFFFGFGGCVFESEHTAVVVRNQVDFKNRFDKFLTALISPFIRILSYFLLLFFIGSSSLVFHATRSYIFWCMDVCLFTILYEKRKTNTKKINKFVLNNILYAENDCVWCVHVDEREREYKKITQHSIYCTLHTLTSIYVYKTTVTATKYSHWIEFRVSLHYSFPINHRRNPVG